MSEVILIVEDDPMNLQLFRDVLNVNGYMTLEAVNGKEGVNIAKNHHPALILMDIQMPVMDGLKATALLKADTETQKIPVIALTAYAMGNDKERMLQAGCDGYIAKPIRTREFGTQVAEYLH